MPATFSDRAWERLRCSHCGEGLAPADGGARCLACGQTYPLTGADSLDLRLKKPKPYAVEYTLGRPLLPENGFRFEPLAMHPQPRVAFSGIRIPWHLSDTLMSHFPKADVAGSAMLDLGCGNGVHREVCEHAGFEWVGLDYADAQAPILGDAHSLPFKAQAFDFILSIAVLEHIQFPSVMMREAHRVLKPGGRFIGTVAFLEPFHGDSYYHHTHLGTFNSLQAAGFTVERVAPVKGWSVLDAQASTLFPRMPAFLSRGLLYPLDALHRIWWRAARLVSDKADENIRLNKTSGAFAFIASKPLIGPEHATEEGQRERAPG